jgi:hypothetical protein
MTSQRERVKRSLWNQCTSSLGVVTLWKRTRETTAFECRMVTICTKEANMALRLIKHQVLKNVQYICGHKTSNSYLIQFYSNTLYYIKHIFPSRASIFNSFYFQGRRSKLLHDWRSVSQNVLVSSTLEGLATRYYFLSECCCPKFAVLFLWGVLSDEKMGLQFGV